MTHAKTEQLKSVPWFAKAGAACSIVPISRFVGPHLFALKGGGYLRGQFQETPALYEQKDGKGSLINFDYNAGLYTVPKQLENGYLAIGKKKVEFHRSAGGK